VRDRTSRVVFDIFLSDEKAAEGFDGVEFTGDGFGGVVGFGKAFFKVFNVLSGKLIDSGDFFGSDKFDELVDIFVVC